MKANDSDPDASKYVHGLRGSMYAHFVQKLGERDRILRHLIWTFDAFAFRSMDV